MKHKKISYFLFILFLIAGITGCDTIDPTETGQLSPEMVDPAEINTTDPTPVLEGDHVIFRGNMASHNSKYYARLIEGEIWVRPNTMRTGEEGPWVKLENLPAELEGDIIEFAMDDEHIIALNSARQIYTMWKANKDIEDFHWQKAWGFPFWGGPGMKLRDDLIKWDFTVVSIEEDEHWTDPVGNLHDVGAGKCSHITMLYEGEIPSHLMTRGSPSITAMKSVFPTAAGSLLRISVQAVPPILSSINTVTCIRASMILIFQAWMPSLCPVPTRTRAV